MALFRTTFSFLAFFTLADSALADTSSIEALKLRLGFSHVEVIPNGCVASLWASGSFSESFISRAINNHIEGKIDPSQINTPLMTKVALGDIQGVSRLLREGDDPNDTNSAGCTALIWSIALKKTEITALLINSKVEVSQTDAAGRTPLMMGAKTKDINTARRLIELGANVNAGQDGGVNEVGSTALMYASRTKENAAMVNFLINQGAEIDVADEHGKTALMQAAWYGRIENIVALIDAGANHKLVSSRGLSALDYATQMDRQKAKSYLSNL